MNRTKIEYIDYTWNPIVGCNGVDCAVSGACWAKKQAKRRKNVCNNCYTFTPHLHAERLAQPLTVKKPSRIGVCFMADLFDEHVPLEWIEQVFKVMQQASWHTFIVLTKHPENVFCSLKFPKNVWFGVSVNRRRDLDRVEELKECDVAVKFVSFEPLFEELGAVDLSGVDWIIIGAQRRPTVLPNRVWVLNLEKEARRVGAKIFRKNNLSGRFSPLQEIPEAKSDD